MKSQMNKYSSLKYPLLILSSTVLVLFFVTGLSYSSDTWFHYEVIETIDINASLTKPINSLKILEHGSVGLWSLCTNENYQSNIVQCQGLSSYARPKYFFPIIILMSSTLIISSFTIFPSCCTTILIIYNYQNIFLPYIPSLLWLLFMLTFILSSSLIATLVLVSLTQFYSPGWIKFENKVIFFRSGFGIFWIVLAATCSLVCFLSLAISLVWKRTIDLKTLKAENSEDELLENETRVFSWTKVIRITRYHDDDASPPLTYAHSESSVYAS